MPQEKFVKKEFNNGHKTFIASEAKAFNEQLKAEKTRREYFDAYKHTMIRDRNPLIGDPTPRVNLMTGVHINQEPIINPNWIPRPLPESITKSQKLTEKIGIETTKYHFLGNSYMTENKGSSSPSQLSPSQGGSGGDSRPLSSAGAAVLNSSRSHHSSPACSRPPSSSLSQQATARSTARPGSDWKARMTEDGTLRPMIRFF